MYGYKRLPIKGIPNLRDLGGWAFDGGMTQYGVFLRSALPKELSEADKTFLLDYGLRTVIDFRSEAEVRRVPGALRSVEGLHYINMPMFDAAAAGGALRLRPSSKFEWREHYTRMLEQQKDWMASVLSTLAAAEGCALFHCTTGKDRAGIISALILSLCGVEGEDIVADYAESEVHLRGVFAEMEAKNGFCAGDIDGEFYRTYPENMRNLLEYLHENYGGAAGYVRACGLDRADADSIRRKLTGKI